MPQRQPNAGREYESFQLPASGGLVLGGRHARGT
jgi:hypothetical protein